MKVETPIPTTRNFVSVPSDLPPSGKCVLVVRVTDNPYDTEACDQERGCPTVSCRRWDGGGG